VISYGRRDRWADVDKTSCGRGALYHAIRLV
jgi:hypothetical protein